MWTSDRVSALFRDALSQATLSEWPLLEEFRLISMLGRGGMGSVFLAHDTKLDRSVAIKFLDGLQTSEASRQRFLTEARAIARLTHPNVVGVYRIGEIHDHPYLVSEFVCGKSLDKLSLPLRWERVLSIALHLCNGLSASHKRGVLHRDLKPANVILTEDDSVKLLDFGLAKLLDAALPATMRQSFGEMSALLKQELATDPKSADKMRDSRPTISEPALTRSGAQMGTPLYMAPEAWRGEPATARTDIYSLGVVLYELCTGRLPHVADTSMALGMRVIHQDAAPLYSVTPEVDPRMGEVVDRCLKRNPEERFLSVDEVYQALRQISGERHSDGFSSLPDSASAPQSVPLRTERRTWILPIAVLATLLLGGVVMGVRSLLRLKPHPAPLAEPANVPHWTRPSAALSKPARSPEALPNAAVERFKVSLGSAAIAGPPDAKVTIVEYSDYACPHCANAGPTLAQLRRAYPKGVRIAFKYYPIKSTPHAVDAARAAMAAREQGEDKFWAYHQKLFENHSNFDDKSFEQFARELGLDIVGFKTDFAQNRTKYDSQIAADRSEGERFGINGVPTFFVNGRRMHGPITNLKKTVEEEIETANALLRTGVGPDELYDTLTRHGREEAKSGAEDGSCCIDPSQVERLLSEAQDDFINDKFQRAIDKAKLVQKLAPVRAFRIIGAAACNIKNERLVNESFPFLDGDGQRFVQFVCERHGIYFRHSGPVHFESQHR